MAKLSIKCPQDYDGSGLMRVVECNRCSGWVNNRCINISGAEELPKAKLIPSCPIQESCQHQIQSNPNACAVRLAGYICESALKYSNVKDAEEHPLAFNADWVCDSFDGSFQNNPWFNGEWLSKAQDYLTKTTINIGGYG